MFDVIIPTYKTPIPFLKKCLESLSNQTCKEYTAWICDGTPHDWIRYDDMMKVINKYPNINYVKQRGTGVSQARNQIIKMGSQSYVAFLDSDDEWDENYLTNMKKQITSYSNAHVGVWFCSLKQYNTQMELVNLHTLGINDEVTFVVEQELSLQNYSVVNFIPKRYHAHFHSGSPIWFTCAVFKREALEKTELFKEGLLVSEDTVLLLDVLDEGYTTHYFDYEGGNRYMHDFQLTKRHDISELEAEHHESFSQRQKKYFTEVEEDKELNQSQKNTLIIWMIDGRTRGISNKNCNNKYNFESKETYELQFI